MASKGLLNCLEKRDLLNRPAVAVENLLSRGEIYEEAGMVSDAVDFYEKAKDREALLRLLDVVREEGDVFLIGRISRILSLELSADDWLVVAERAGALGKSAFYQEACRRAGKEVPAGPTEPDA